MPTITLDMPEDVVARYGDLDEIRQVLYEDFVASEYQKGTISLRQGANLLGLTYEKFMVDFLGGRKLSFINGTPQELEAESQQEHAWLDEVLEELS